MTRSRGFATDEFIASLLRREEIDELQTFENSNPEYWLLTHGHPPGPNDVAEGFDSRPPADMSYSEHFHFVIRERASAEILGQVDAATDLMARGVYHLGFFITATKTHGTGFARRVYEAYERWAIECGARWLRLGVVAANARAEAFWRRVGYVEVRRKDGYVLGELSHQLITMAKPVNGENLSDYLDAIPRDRSA